LVELGIDGRIILKCSRGMACEWVDSDVTGQNPAAFLL
jgi:hypothetical protein